MESMQMLRQLFKLIPTNGKARYANYHKENTPEYILLEALRIAVVNSPDFAYSQYISGIRAVIGGLIVAEVDWTTFRTVLASV